MKQRTEVVAALVVRGGKFLICRRAEGRARAHLWEFVGGKREAGETEAEALAWIAPSEISSYAFCPADTEILEKIGREGI